MPDQPSSQTGQSAKATWAEVLARFPDPDAACLRAARILVQLGRLVEADELLTDGQARYPTSARIADEWVRLAHTRRDFLESARRCENTRARFPDDPAGYYGGAVCLRELRLYDEANALIEEGLAKFPNEPELLYQPGLLAYARGEFDKAIRWWDHVRTKYPNVPGAYIYGTAVLRESQRYEEAEAVASLAVQKFPHEPAAWFQHAFVAQERRDWPAAVTRWQQTRVRFPSRAEGYVHGVEALSQEQRFDEAEDLVRQAIGLFPSDRSVIFSHADLATRCNDWAAALTRWTQARRMFPNDPSISPQIFTARMRLFESDPNAAAAIEAGLPLGPLDLSFAAGLPRISEDGTAMHEVMMAFESLGGNLLGCEFGGMQRAFGAEPLGLLRWTEMGPDQIIAALEARFDGVGTPDFTDLRLLEHDGRNEYITGDKRFGMASHTFIDDSEIPWERMFTQSCRRIRYLKDKLIEDLTNGTKIFVYKTSWRNLTEVEVDRLYEALQLYGKNTLLYVRYSDAAHSDSTVEQVKPNLMIGYVERFVGSKDGTALSGDAGERIARSWGAICVAAYKHWKAQNGAVIPTDNVPIAHHT
jgi:tetratricopeptide (TPR) repeat protein